MTEQLKWTETYVILLILDFIPSNAYMPMAIYLIINYLFCGNRNNNTQLLRVLIQQCLWREQILLAISRRSTNIISYSILTMLLPPPSQIDNTSEGSKKKELHMLLRLQGYGNSNRIKWGDKFELRLSENILLQKLPFHFYPISNYSEKLHLVNV